MAATPELLLPADGVTCRLQSLVFSWEAVTSPVGPYILEIATDSGFTAIVSKIETTLTQMEAVITPGNFYYWRVRVDALTSTGVRTFSAPAFLPAAVESHIADGKARLLTQFQEGS
jgi:hypothetical protein